MSQTYWVTKLALELIFILKRIESPDENCWVLSSVHNSSPLDYLGLHQPLIALFALVIRKVQVDCTFIFSRTTYVYSKNANNLSYLVSILNHRTSSELSLFHKLSSITGDYLAWLFSLRIVNLSWSLTFKVKTNHPFTPVSLVCSEFIELTMQVSSNANSHFPYFSWFYTNVREGTALDITERTTVSECEMNVR